MTGTSPTCDHEPCNCKARDGSDFCSPACEQAHKNGDTECPCPHNGCSGHS